MTGLIRTQLAIPNGHVLSPQAYDQIFTMHGTTMIFLFVMPMLTGFGNYIVPLMIGARDMAFPRLNAFGYWIVLFAGLFLNSSFLLGQAPNVGWFNYAPLTATGLGPGLYSPFASMLVVVALTTVWAGASVWLLGSRHSPE